uniref:Uncharacterized protein n=1 Tax=Arundo donax TaxID=35708 RepID=A0A0A9CCE4_ARUDO
MDRSFRNGRKKLSSPGVLGPLVA